MRTFCTISGLPIFKSNYLLGFDLADEHPIFRAKRSLVYTPRMVHTFMTSESQDEKALIFLAYLNATDLVSFRVPARPTLQVMASQFPRLSWLGQWVAYAKFSLARMVSFPEYVVDHGNQDLSNIRAWLDAIEEIKGRIEKSEYLRDKNAELLQKELEIKRELGQAISDGRTFTPKLAKWALEICEITFVHADYQKWMKVLCTSKSDAWTIDSDDLKELQEILECKLPLVDSNPQAISIMHQMRELEYAQKVGFQEFSIFDSEDGAVKEFEILEDDGEGKMVSKPINQHLKDIPETEPVRKNYETLVKYLVAKAKWDIAQSKKPKDPPSEIEV